MACLRPVSSESTDSKSQKSIIEIYTDWANHYLDKTKGKKRISDLQTELSDGIILSEVIEAVTQQKIPDINKKPKTNAAMVTNIQACLNFLRAKGVAVEDILPEEIREGNLKAILGLFFQLSRFKQQQKQLTGIQRGSVPNSPAKLSSIPIPGSGLSPKRGGENKKVEIQGNRSFLPGKSNSIPTAVKQGENLGKLGDKPGIKPPTGRTERNGIIPTNYDQSGNTKQSMLERLKIGRTSHISGSSIKPGLGKRTSSSSGFSSARSDQSESSISLSSDTNFPSPSALRRIQENQEIVQADQARRSGIRNKLTRAQSKDKSCSPKRSPKLGRNSGVTEIKDYGPIDESRVASKPENYPPHAYSRSNSGISFKHTNISSSDGYRRDQQTYISSPVKTSRLGTGIPAPGRLAAEIGKPPSSPAPSKQPGASKPPPPPLRTHSISQDPKPQDGTGSLAEKQVLSEVSAQNDKMENDRSSVTGNSQNSSPSHQSKTCSLPRQKRRGDMTPGPNVAIVSPMPSLKRSDKMSKEENCKKEDTEDPMQGIAPMAPLGFFRGRNGGEIMGGGREIGSMQTVNTALVTGCGEQGYMSDSDVCRRRGNMDSGYISEGGVDTYLRGRNKAEDGYASEGGAEFYNKKIEQRMAYERQREDAEKAYLEMAGRSGKHKPLPQVLGRQGSVHGGDQGFGQVEQVYKVVGGRRNVEKADSGIQTEISEQKRKPGNPEHGKLVLSGSKEKEQWRAAMERSRRVLTSQEQAMEEYLRRQSTEAEKHIRNSPMMMRRNMNDLNTHPGRQGGIASMPGTPTGNRRNVSRHRGLVLQDPGSAHSYSRGGSLERQQKLSLQEPVSGRYDAVSDSEYMHGNFKSSPGKDNSRSLPKGTSALNYGLLMGQIQQKRQQRQRTDGSISDSNYATYSELQGLRGVSQSPYQWLQPANTYSGWGNHEELGSSESINSVSSSIKNARSQSLTKANVLLHHMETQRNPTGKIASPRNYSRLSKPEETEYYGVPFLLKGSGSRFTSQPSSPLHGDKTILQDLGSPAPSSLKYSSLPSYSSSGKQKHKNNLDGTPENLNGSNLSLVSDESSVYSTQEERTNADIAKLQRELVEEQHKVMSLTNQLNTNAHVVSAFEQSLANMTSRLQQITKTAERKDAELGELRRTMDVLRQSGIDAGLIAAKSAEREPNELMRQMSTDSVTSMSSAHSNTSLNSGDERERGKKGPGGPKRSGWLRSSFSKAFSRSKMKSKGGSVSDCDDGSITRMTEALDSEQDSPDLNSETRIQLTRSSSDLRDDGEDEMDPELVDELKRQLIEKETLLTETRLEALSSAHQLESLKDTVTKMKTELMNLRQDNEKLHTQVVHKSLGSSESSLNTSHDPDLDRRLSLAMSETSVLSGPSTLDLSGTTDPNKQDSKLVSILVEISESQPVDSVKIGTIAASGKLSWELLDSLVERLFKEFVMRVDPVTNLGLGAESILSYEVGEISRFVGGGNPELLPYGYLIGDVNSIKIVLKHSGESGGVDSLAFQTLTPKSILQRYVSLLQEHRRVILSGPSATGKSFIADKLANFLVRTCTRGKSPRVEIFKLERGNLDSFREFLVRINLESETRAESLPHVVILDNLQYAPDLDEILSSCLTAGTESCPFIIGTMVQTAGSASSTNLQLKHSFRWILCANHVEPVRGFLARYLRQKLLLEEAETRAHNGDSARIIEWVSKSFLIINKFLESHCSPESTLSPGMFISCPTDTQESKLWFINLWNLMIVPHMLDSVREGLQMYGKRASWEDPLQTILESWPWANLHLDQDTLVHIHPGDVGFDMNQPLRPVSRASLGNPVLEDPLFNMLMTLQEAANTESGDL